MGRRFQTDTTNLIVKVVVLVRCFSLWRSMNVDIKMVTPDESHSHIRASLMFEKNLLFITKKTFDLQICLILFRKFYI